MGGFDASRAIRMATSARLLGLVFRQENYLRLARERFNVGGVGQASGAHVAPDDFFQIFFEEGNIALGHFDHARPVGMTAGNRRSKIRQAGRNHRPQVPRTVYADLHSLSLFPVRNRARSGVWQGFPDICPTLYLQPWHHLFNAREGDVPRAMYAGPG